MAMAERAAGNLEALRRNTYPGRGLVLGQTPDGRRLVQLYWLMGRSENSRNRILVSERGSVRTAALDPARLRDPSLVIYRALGVWADCHVVSNGDQTDTILTALERGGSFQQALRGRTFEPDAPNHTPRISGLMRLGDPGAAYEISVLRAAGGDPACCLRCFYAYERARPGLGHCVTTYAGDGTPLPSFEGDPRPVPIPDDLAAAACLYWEALHPSTRVALVAKDIDLQSGESRMRIINGQEAAGPGA